MSVVVSRVTLLTLFTARISGLITPLMTALNPSPKTVHPVEPLIKGTL